MSSNEENEPITKIIGKEYSPLIIRRYNRLGVPLFVALITDDNLDDLDKFIINKIENATINSIQKARNFAGWLTEELVKHYKKAEGVAVIIYYDKMMVSSLWGDFMNHTACRIELYTLLLMMTNI